jgi:hypothetical protein
MKKRNLSTYFALLFLVVNACSCKLLGIENKLIPCQTYVSQNHKFGQYIAEVKANKMALQIGDTIFLNLKINQQFYDSLIRQTVKVSEKVALFVKVGNAVGPPKAGNVFATDTTIYHVFDQYFTTRVLKGSKNDAYLFDCALKDGFWELALQYIVLKKGKYDLSVSFRQIQTGEPPLPKGVCMTGDAEVLGAQVTLNTLNNQINRVYPTSTSLTLSSDHFGFIIE